MEKKIAVVHGRFQPLHNGHLEEYILEGWRRCDYLIIGITNSDPFHIRDSINDPQRSKPENNPLDFYERLEMIKLTLLDEGLTLNDFEIVPFPINFPDLLPKFVPRNAKHYVTIYDNWGNEKAEVLSKVFGHENVEILFARPNNEKKISATLVRRNIKNGKNWEDIVPKAVAKYLKENNLLERIIKGQSE